MQAEGRQQEAQEVQEDKNSEQCDRKWAAAGVSVHLIMYTPVHKDIEAAFEVAGMLGVPQKLLLALQLG